MSRWSRSKEEQAQHQQDDHHLNRESMTSCHISICTSMNIMLLWHLDDDEEQQKEGAPPNLVFLF